jgi:Predicted transcriptional regulator
MRHLTPAESRIIESLRNSGKPMKYAELRELSRGNHRSIKTLVDDGFIERLPMGLYTYFDPEKDLDSSFETFAALTIARPDAVICFDSAAAFHGLTVQNPSEIWAAFPYNSSPPRGGPGLELKPSRWNERSMTAGIITVEISGVQVKMTSPARTVIDFQRFAKSKGSEETAGEVLMNFAESNRMADLITIARELGCERSIRPRLEMAQAMGRRR